EGHGGYVRGCVFSPDGKRIVTTSTDKTARLWDPRPARAALDGRPRASPPGHTGSVFSCAFSPDGTRVLTG
ncbi:WD40-repeat-containing domain protein, partial [Pelagophyceae sp. CCMP2097]